MSETSTAIRKQLACSFQIEAFATCKDNMRVIFLWYWTLALSWLTITKQRFSVEFSATSAPLVLTAYADELFQLSYDSSYGLVLWVKWGLPPSATSTVAQLSNGVQMLLSVTQRTDGRWTASTTSSSGVETITSPVLSLIAWTHIGVSVCSVTGLLSLYVTEWQGLTAFSSVSASFLSLDPRQTTLTLGSGVVGQVLDCRMSISCLTPSDISAIVTSTTCHDQCPGNCFGPGDRSCNDYIQLIDELVPWTVTSNYYTWTRDDPHLQGHSFGSYFYSFTGWFYQTSISGSWNNLFRSQSLPGDMGVVGQRLFTIFQQSSNYLHITADFSSIVNDITNVNYPVSANQPNILNNWMFVGASLSPTLRSVCYAFSPTDVNTHCTTFPTPSTNNLMWGTTATSALFIGDPYFNGIIGKIADGRYYFGTNLLITDMDARYQARKVGLGTGCASMTSPFECSSCTSGYFLDSASQCKLCNACCLACTGAGNMSCSGCAPPCQLVGGACIGKR